MEGSQMDRQQLTGQLEALEFEIQDLRDECAAATENHDRIRARVVASEYHMENILQRLQKAERRQQELFRHWKATNLQPPIGSGRSQLPRSGGTGADDHLPSYHSSCDTSVVPSPIFPSSVPGFPSRNAFQQPGDSGTTPRPDKSLLVPPQTRLRIRIPSPGLPARPADDYGQRQAKFGSTLNAAYLPMVIENILVDRKSAEHDGKLRTCGFPFQLPDGTNLQCAESSLQVACFRAKHFHYCRTHMGVIPASKTSCSDRPVKKCIGIVFGECDDWDTIVDAAVAAGNLGNKGLDVQDLKEALFPPHQYPYRYTA